MSSISQPCSTNSADVLACSNASNDAAYTMLNLVLLATRWKDLTSNSLDDRLQSSKHRNTSLHGLNAELSNWRRLSGNGHRVMDMAGKTTDRSPPKREKDEVVRETNVEERPPEEETRPFGWFARLFGRVGA